MLIFIYFLFFGKKNFDFKCPHHSKTQVCTQLNYNDNGQPLQAMTLAQQLITMDKEIDDDDKVGGYDNTAAISFFSKFKNGGDGNLDDPTKYVRFLFFFLLHAY